MTKEYEGGAPVGDEQSTQAPAATDNRQGRLVSFFLRFGYPITCGIFVVTASVSIILCINKEDRPAEPASLAAMSKTIATTEWDKCGEGYWNRVADPRSFIRRQFEANHPITGGDVWRIAAAAEQCNKRIASMSDDIATIALQRKILGLP
jgi:hypothetical protein